MAAEFKRNPDKGELDIIFDGETVAILTLDELNQNHPSFQSMLEGILVRSYQRAYRLGAKAAKDRILEAAEEV